MRLRVPRMWKTLVREGADVGRDRIKTVAHPDNDPRAPRPGDLVERDFTAVRLDELRVADFTYLHFWEGVEFFSFVIGVYSRRIVGSQFASHMRTTLVLDALKMALTRGRSRADFQLLCTATPQPIQQIQLRPDPRQLRRPRINRTCRRRIRQRPQRKFVDSFKTELIRDRIRQTRTKLELAIGHTSNASTPPDSHTSLDDTHPTNTTSGTTTTRQWPPSHE